MRFISFILFFCSTFLLSQQQFYVSVNGSNSNDGLSHQNAFATVDRAKTAVSAFMRQHPSGRDDIIVNISPGTYTHSRPLTFTQRDGGSGNRTIIYRKNPFQNGRVIISGGKQIVNWEIHDGSRNIWKAEIGKDYARQIFVRGKQRQNVSKAVRARSNYPFNMKEYRNGYKVRTKGIDFRNWKHIRDLEVVSNLYWVSTRIPVMDNYKAKRLLIEPEFWNHIHIQWNVYQAPFSWLENSLELLDSPNEWYIDRLSRSESNTLYFHFGDSNPENLEIILPVTDKLISAKNLTNVAFENIDFEFTTWNGPSTYIPKRHSNNGFRAGLNDRYTEYSYKTGNYKDIAQIPGALSFDNCSRINIRNCSVSHIGSTAIEFINNSSHNLIENCEITDVSGSGISFHNWKSSDKVFNKGISQLKSNPVGTGNKILNNKIHDVANDYMSSSGICIGFVQNTLISRNEIHDFPNSGIAFSAYIYDNIRDDGSVVDANRLLFFGTNEVSNNKIDCAEQLLPDGGGIYTIGYHGNKINSSAAERTKIHDNIILNQKFYQGGIYLDKFSANIDVYNNVVDIQDHRQTQIMYGNPVYSIVCRYASRNISIYNNLCNSRYLPIPDCLDGQCENLVISANSYFYGYEAYK